MSLKGFEQILKDHPAFMSFDEETRALLAGCAKNEQFAPGEMIYREGDPADRVFLLRRGDVSIEVSAPARKPIVIETAHPGDILNWGWMVPPYTCMSDARAQGAVSAVSLDATCMRGKCDANHALGYEMFQHWLPLVARRVRALRLQLLDVYAPAREVDHAR